MTDQGNPSTPSENDNLVQRDAQGDVIPLGTRMIEVESYERVVEGLKIAAEGAAHLAVHEYRSKNVKACNSFSGLARRLDGCRMTAVDIAKLHDRARETETKEVRSDPLPYREARRRLRDGIKQSAGGMRQLATCHRLDLRWSLMASTLDEMEAKLTGKPSAIVRPPKSGLILH